MVKVTVNGQSVELPAFMQPGQTPGTLGIALGYGRGDGGENIDAAHMAKTASTCSPRTASPCRLAPTCLGSPR